MILLNQPEYSFLKTGPYLVRLYLMCLDILEKEEIVTYREADHNLLMDIRNGQYQKADHTFSAEFYDLLNGLKKRLDYVKENTSLPSLSGGQAAGDAGAAVCRRIWLYH